MKLLENDASLVQSVQTGLLKTKVYSTGAAFHWLHELGDKARYAFSDHTVSFQDTQNEQLLAIGQGDGTRRKYVVTAEMTMHTALHTQTPAQLRKIGVQWGKAINLVHVSPAGAALTHDMSPRSLQRSQDWLNGQWKIANRILGSKNLSILREWAQSMAQSSDRCVSHGQPGMAHFLVSTNPNDQVLLTGEDLGIADPHFDFGWVLGELAELEAFYPDLQDNVAAVRKGLMSEVPNSYSTDEWNVSSAYRLSQHAYDWHHYAGASEEHAGLLLHLADRLMNSLSSKVFRRTTC
ncbi:hypothetical protein AUR04nite_34140 [Glutamicibacter uratoxydans]|uniref:Aminoglycoside phosphotransferase domain-containing protein n=1 Tax=Glutamicibacter uratoxydans TaxID=43667 RepID=A0A4Y4DRB5_GLUUR|nr:hypothetical protein [Glutamicibacter uratoxydans]GED07882.1 hypothetical protein AUR04nite_34140 [Glutamicibacter uratoxydans]